MKKVLFLLCAGLCLLVSSAVRADSAVNVPIDDPVYRDVDRLVGARLVRDVLYGQRPWSRDEIARLIIAAQKHLDALPPPMSPDDHELSFRLEFKDLLEKMRAQFRDEVEAREAGKEDRKLLNLHPLYSVDARYTFVDSEARAVPNNGLGTVDALIEPLIAYREGRHYPDGHQLSLETEHFLRLTRFLSFYARPRFEFDVTHGGDASVDPFVQQLYGKFTVPHFEIEVGRDSVEWGQGPFGGILLSNNARPLDLIKLSNPSPSTLPWIFRYIGPIRYSLFVANLGPEREFSDSFLTGLKLSFKPVSFFEFGFSQLVMMGGDGSPALSFGKGFEEFIGFRGSAGATTNPANRETGFDFRFYLPFLRETQIYLDIQFEDIYKSQAFMLTELAFYHAGIFIPRLDNTGENTLRLEYRHGSPYFYRHGTFTTGMALNRRLWGDELGPQGDGAYVTFTHQPSDRFFFSITGQYERRDGDVLQELLDANGDNRRLVVATPTPAEHRILADFKTTYDFNPKIRLSFDFGYERIINFNFVDGDGRNAFLTELGLKFHLF